MTRTGTLLQLVDTQQFRTLFVEELGWHNPDRPDLTFQVNGNDYVLTQIAGYKGLRIWHHDGCPPRPVQRAIDVEVGQDTAERMIIFHRCPQAGITT